MTTRLLALAALCAAGFGLVLSPAAAQDFLGKPMAKWLEDLNPSKSVGERRSAAFALGKIGKQATPALGALGQSLKDTDPGVREAAAFAIGEICGKARAWNEELLKTLAGLVQNDPDPLVRRSAACAVGHMGKATPEAKAALNAGLADKEPAVRQNVAWALGRLGDDMLPGLRRALKDADTLVRRDAAGSVARLSAGVAADALPELVKCAADKDVELRKAAVAALVRLTEFARPEEIAAAKAPLAQALKDREPEIRRNAALAMAGLGGQDALSAMEVLLDLLQNGSLNMRRQVALALKNVGPEAKAAVPALRKALADPDEELRMNAAVAFIGLKATGEPAVPDLTKLVVDQKEAKRVRMQAAVALSRIGFGPGLKEAMPLILRVVADPSETGQVRERALWPVRTYLNNSPDRVFVFKTLTAILNEPTQRETKMLRYDCAYLLGMFQGATAPEKALDVLLLFLKDPEIKLYAGGTGGPEGQREGGQPTGVGFKEKGVDDGRIMAVQALKEIGARRVVGRPDIVIQLRALNTDPNTLPNLAKGLKEFLPELEKGK
ncbi:MAG: HEAT repeat domain-containing protein [Gemmataceae bacterium]|nr:HEAT repeat domain-containing protein [Gemmataceae bacterium]